MLCEIRLGSAPWQRVRLLDLSCDGFRISWFPNGLPGERLWVRLPGIEPLAAELRWRDGQAIGCRFANPLGVYVFDHLTRLAEASR